MKLITNFYGQIGESLKSQIEKYLDSIEIPESMSIDIYFDLIKLKSHSSNISILILNEPPAVMPENYKSSNYRKFNLVIVLSPWRAESLGIDDWAFIPVPIPKIRLDSNGIRRDAVVFMNDHKFSASNTSLYATRRRILLKMQALNLPIFLFGTNWRMSRFTEFRKRVAAFRRVFKNMKIISLKEAFSELFAKYACYQGRAESKLETLAGFKFALVIENDKEVLSEKLFDALYAGCMVFYMGPSLDRFPLLRECVINLPFDISDGIAKIQENLDNPPFRILERSHEFISNPSHMDFVNEIEIARTISRHIKSFVMLPHGSSSA